MQQHTLGPWRAHHKTDAHCRNRYMITGISRHDGRIAHVADDVVEHNVPLISAAPELLAALIVLRHRHQVDEPHHEHLCEFCKMANAAIAKAQGFATTEQA